MKVSDIGTQVLIAGATAAVATTIGVLITNWLTKESTIKSVASGETPLPPGSKPTTTGPPINVAPVAPPPTPPPPAPPPPPSSQNLLSIASQLATPPADKCPMGYHWVPNNDPWTKATLPGMCIPD